QVSAHADGLGSLSRKDECAAHWAISPGLCPCFAVPIPHGAPRPEWLAFGGFAYITAALRGLNRPRLLAGPLLPRGRGPARSGRFSNSGSVTAIRSLNGIVRECLHRAPGRAGDAGGDPDQPVRRTGRRPGRHRPEEGILGPPVP